MTGVLIPAATEQEWLDARRRGVTASEIAVIMGLSPWDSPYALYHRKTGDLPGPEDNLAMALGRHLESFVAELFAQRFPDFSVHGDGRALHAHEDRPWQLATPDRIVAEGGGWQQDGPGLFSNQFPKAVAVLECKTSASYDGWGDDGSDEIPVHYRCQLLWQMDVLGVTSGFVACLFLHSRQLRVYELGHGPGSCSPDDGSREPCAACEDLFVMRSEAVRFLARLEHREPPEIDWRPATSDALKHIHPMLDPDVTMTIPARLARWYRAALRDLKDAERRKVLHENRIRDILGTGRYANSPDGLPVARRDVYDVPAKTIERKAFTVDKLVPVKPKEEASP
jgi:putative phage-type endonuclease